MAETVSVFHDGGKRRRLTFADVELDFESPFCLVNREDGPETLFFKGTISEIEKLDQIPRKQNKGKSAVSLDGRTFDTISMIPFSQIAERGFKVHNEGEKILCLQIESVSKLNTETLAKAIPPVDIECEDEFSFSKTTEEYEEIVRNVKELEICGGEGSSFVTPNRLSGKIRDFDVSKALSIFRRLILNEFGSYWKFLFFDGKNFFAGATPERHLSVDEGKVRMNPISGTFRKNQNHTAETLKKDLFAFLENAKEIDELFMVTDEELKMMCKICPDGGAVVGPLLKEMSQLIHTEYLLEGNARGKDVIECFRKSMFAPTVTGSPMGNACARLYNYEKESRKYYSAACVLIGHFEDGSAALRESNGDHSVSSDDPAHAQSMNGGGATNRDSCAPSPSQPVDASVGLGSRKRGASLLSRAFSGGLPVGEEFLDSCITIRTQEIRGDGRFDIRVGATLVKDSVPSEEVKETEWKLKAAMLSLKSSAECAKRPIRFDEDVFTTEEQRKGLMERLEKRNLSVSRFWLTSQPEDALSVAHLKGKKALVLNNEDDFAHMLEHIMMRQGWEIATFNYETFEDEWKKREELGELDLVIVGPGPGDPACPHSDRMKVVRRVVQRLLDTNQEFLCVCLGHQCLGLQLGLEICKKDFPQQGEQKMLSVFGKQQRVGFYNSFFVKASDQLATTMGFEVSEDPETREIYAMRNNQLVAFQFHPESILTENGFEIIKDATSYLLEKRSARLNY
uniref:anthranilate synthase n=1 Tax=Chromera velia CCMP2878 TaxID=1169474 RepID=A0A0G4F1S3_9ALVE|mmetsp:Transcript_29225/g.57332  ORF Transcript_29225/g.57332 Transcript_29225/m.57332 type:complete len:738 (-) Transcript_29225:654-2867(-)|eukprot:Cvel_2631.t1-p1 / transcript=Cvel_2631.t1 / gene=Cvel_2631 / organism=Chromera_velia_CCMP2878 / gene_product=Anthranilate synthase, phenazine specific, putative / transcript_product=Anthranilate synthase, phenazine specific, putative / location=Cvel_scaffold104:52335-59132(+) / protein_length=737 / sequence_SO=supercontig / SO=protein_coding / is_pseudo=false